MGGKNPIGVIPYFSQNLIPSVYSLMNQKDASDVNLDSLALTAEMMDAWRANDKDLFEQLRTDKLMQIEKDMLEWTGLEII